MASLSSRCAVLCILVTAVGYSAPPQLPRRGYIPVPEGYIRPRPLAVRGSSPQRILYLNRYAGTYRFGYDDSSANTSTIVQGNTTLAPFPYGDDSWNAIVDCVRGLFARYAIEITEIDPAPTPHIEAVVSTTSEQIDGQLYSGVAPMDPYCAVMEEAIVFNFATICGDDVAWICETIGQETGHALGMDHEFYCPDVMTYEVGCGDKSFADYDTPCGEYSARTCYCGAATQNSHRHLLSVLGAGDTSAPTVSITSPNDGATLAMPFEVNASAFDESGIEAVEFLVDGKQVGRDESEPYEFLAPTTIADGSHALGVRATDRAGNSAIDIIEIEVARSLPTDDPQPEDDPTSPGSNPANKPTGISGGQSQGFNGDDIAGGCSFAPVPTTRCPLVLLLMVAGFLLVLRRSFRI